MDVIFDIDGTLANAEHRLHLIVPDPNVLYEQPFQKDWDRFLSDDMVAKDTVIPAIWCVLSALICDFNTVLFITGRPERQRETTWRWLTDDLCAHRRFIRHKLLRKPERLYMRQDGDRRPSHEVKRELLRRARYDGYSPQLVFEDRKDDTKMWRSEGLLCCQVAVGEY